MYETRHITTVRPLVSSWCVALIIGASLPSSAAYAQPCRPSPTRGPTIQDPRLAEISGVAPSRSQPHILWVHNDSGYQPWLFAIDARDGSTRGVWAVTGAQNVDWEDIALAQCPSRDDRWCLFIADVGDNLSRRDDPTLYIVPEPHVPEQPHPDPDHLHDSESAHALRLIYQRPPDLEARPDIESLAVHHSSKYLYLFTKGRSASAVLEASPPGPQDTSLSFTQIASLPIPLATAADISPDDRWLIVRGYFHAFLYDLGPQAELPSQASLSQGQQPRITLPSEPQGEAIAFTVPSAQPRAAVLGHWDLITVSERLQQPLWRYQVECDEPPAPPTEPDSPMEPPPEPDDMAPHQHPPDASDTIDDPSLGNNEPRAGCSSAARGSAAPRGHLWSAWILLALVAARLRRHARLS